MNSSTEKITIARDLLSAHGLKRTVPRIAILKHLLCATVPQTAAQIEDGVAGHGFNQSTIYRTMECLVETGLVSQREFGDRVWRFEMRKSGAPLHPHTLCLECGCVQCVESTSQPKWAEIMPVGFQLAEVVFRGRCAKCTAK